MRKVCRNKWCKSSFESVEEDEICPRCMSLDREVSGGVSWQEKKYEGPRFDGMPHQINIKVNRYFK